MGQTIARLAVTARGEAVGPYGAALLVLRSRSDLLWCRWAEDVVDLQTHDVLVKCLKTGKEVGIAYGRRSRDAQGVPVVRANLGALPLLFEDTAPGEVAVRVGYRRAKT